MALDPTELGKSMQLALPKVWKEIKGTDLPTGGDPKDSEVLFRAIALGLLEFLKKHEDEFILNVAHELPTALPGPPPGRSTFKVVHLNINANLPPP
ncbi:MAG TPA: hypothetical protein VHR66_24780 [Gemmataceae bacterium]|jgi:hypothetical protein|nr:hypothetical protein [Gemmataceae bacterium]